jgi:hypothetical protein
VAVAVWTSAPARADIMNNEAIREHVDALFADGSLEASRLRAHRLTLNLGLLVPVYGSIALDRKVFGGIRPSAIVFDWVLGGIVPAGLAVAAFAGPESWPRTRLAWTAIGLYAATRVAVLVVGNLHISEYNRLLELRVGAATPISGDLAPALLATATW